MVCVSASSFDGLGGERVPGLLGFAALLYELESTLDMPPLIATPTAKPPRESPIVDLTGTKGPLISALPLKTNESVLAEATVPVNRDTGHPPDGVPPVLNGFLI